MNQEISKTRVSLLNRLRLTPDDPASWDEFVSTYGPRINRWCRGWGLQASDAEDVTQNVMVAMARQMRDFEYDANGRFRSWLKTISHRAWIDFLKSRRKGIVGSGSDEIHGLLSSVETEEDFLKNIEEECEKGMLEEAMLIVRRRVNDNTWQAFQMTALDGVSGLDVSRELEMAVTAVYKAKSRVQMLLKNEIERIDQTFLN